MTVHIKYGGSIWLFGRWLLRLPQRPGPLGHHLGQAFVCSSMGQARENPFGVALTVGTLAACQYRYIVPV